VLSEEEAIAFANSGVWKEWNSEEIVEFQLFQECLAMPFDIFHAAIEEVLGRLIFTHEFTRDDLLQAEYHRKVNGQAT